MEEHSDHGEMQAPHWVCDACAPSSLWMILDTHRQGLKGKAVMADRKWHGGEEGGEDDDQDFEDEEGDDRGEAAVW